MTRRTKLPGWMVTKARKRKTLLDAAERLRKACGDDDLFVAVVRGEAIPWRGFRSEGVLKAKDRRTGHDGKMRNAGTGRFSPMDGPITTKLDNGLVVEHTGAVHPALRRLSGT